MMGNFEEKVDVRFGCVLAYWNIKETKRKRFHWKNRIRHVNKKNKQTTKFNDEKHYPVIKKNGGISKIPDSPSA